MNDDDDVDAADQRGDTRRGKSGYMRGKPHVCEVTKGDRGSQASYSHFRTHTSACL